MLLKGKSEEAYNVADAFGDITLKDLATMTAKCTGMKAVFDLPDTVEAAGFSRAIKARLDGNKARINGWFLNLPFKGMFQPDDTNTENGIKHI